MSSARMSTLDKVVKSACKPKSGPPKSKVSCLETSSRRQRIRVVADLTSISSMSIAALFYSKLRCRWRCPVERQAVRESRS